MNSTNNPNLNILDMDLLQQNVTVFSVQLNNLSWDEFFILISNKKYWSLDLIQDMGSIAFDLIKSKKQLSSTPIILKSQNTSDLNLVSNQLQNSACSWFDDLVTATKKLIHLKENAIIPFSPSEEANWFRNGEKYKMWNNFYHNRAFYNSENGITSVEYLINEGASGDAEFLKDLGYEPENLLEMCFTLQYLKFDIGNIKLPNPIATTMQFFRVYEEQALTKSIGSIVEYPCTKKNIEDVINLLTCDLTSCAPKDFYPDVLEKPFIKIGNTYVLISYLIANLQFTTSIINAVMKKAYTQEKTKEVNKQILSEFVKQGFKPPIKRYLTDIKYKIGTLEGDIDILAYKDGYLFVIETKYTFIRLKVKQLNEHKETLQKGAHQLTKAEKYITENFSVIKDILSLQENNISELKGIKTLLVSTSFDFDDYDFGHQKISLFELLGVLRGESHLLFNNLTAISQGEKLVVTGSNNKISGSIFLREITKRIFWGNLY